MLVVKQAKAFVGDTKVQKRGHKQKFHSQPSEEKHSEINQVDLSKGETGLFIHRRLTPSLC